VSATPELDVVERRLSAGRIRKDVVELEEAALTTATTVGGDEGAAAAVASVRAAAHFGRRRTRWDRTIEIAEAVS
jgi:hypothetical protein